MTRGKGGLRIAARVLAALVGSYFVTAGAAALIAVLLVLGAGASRSDAMVGGSMLSYVIFAVLMLWCFAERRLARVWLVLTLAAIATHALAFWIEPTLPITGATPWERQ